MNVIIEIKDGENIIGCGKLTKQLMNIKDGGASVVSQQTNLIYVDVLSPQ